LEGLERVLVAVGILEAGGAGATIGEPLVAAKPDRLAVLESGPLDREAHEAGRIGLLHVEGEEDDVGPRDRAHLHGAVGLLAHPLPRC